MQYKESHYSRLVSEDDEPIVPAKRFSSTKSRNSMDAHSKHLKRLAEDYIIPNKDLPKYTPSVKTDFEVLQENYRFLRTEKDDRQQGDSGKLARAYDNLLFKEFCLADVSNTKRKGVGMRWRTEAEVRSGKGSTICGCVDCQNVENLTQYEVDFAYLEQGEQKHSLVKLTLCPTCQPQVFPQKTHHSRTHSHSSKQKKHHKSKKHRRHHNHSTSPSDSSSSDD